MAQYNPNPTPTANKTGWTADAGVTLTATADGLRVQKAAGLSSKYVYGPGMNTGTKDVWLSRMAVRRNTATSRGLYWLRIGASDTNTAAGDTYNGWAWYGGYGESWRSTGGNGNWVYYPRSQSFKNTSGKTYTRLEFELPTAAVDITLRSMFVDDSATLTDSYAPDDSDAGINFTIPTNSLTITAQHDALNDEAVHEIVWGGAFAGGYTDFFDEEDARFPPVLLVFGTPGIKTGTVTVRMPSYPEREHTRTYTISVPAGTFEAHYSYETDFLSVNVDASASIAPSLDPISTYAWNWGDGTTTAASSSKYASHTYAAPGIYNVTLTTRTPSGGTNRSATETKSITATAPPNPDNYFVASKDLLKVAFVPSIQDGTSYAWTFGDGQTSTVKEPVVTYGTPGTYSVTLTVNGTLTTTRDVTVNDVYTSLSSMMDALRLEVAIPYPAGTIYNRIKNPSGELGAWAWVTPVSNSYLTGSTTSVTAADKGISGAKLIYRSSGSGAQVLYSRAEKVVAGQYVSAQLQSPYVDGYYRATVEALSASGAVLGSSATTGYQAASASATVRTTAYLLPADTTHARLRLNHTSDTGSGVPAVGKLFHFRRVMLATAGTAAELTSLPYAEYANWQDLIGPTSDISVSRSALDVGTLSATILDSTFDPATNGTIRPGQAVRLRAKTQDSSGNLQWASVFTGTLNEADVDYVAVKGGTPGPKATKIKLTASDAVTVLTQTKEPRGVAKIGELPELLEGVGVPFEVNGSSGQVPTASIVSENPNSSVLDQVAITRDTDAGYAYVDRDNVLQAREPALMPTVAVGVIDESAYSDVAASFNTGEAINSVTIKWLRYTPASGVEGEEDYVEAKVEEIPYGPYEDLPSIEEWGLRPATFTMQGVENPTAIAAKGQAILAANSQPSRMINQVLLPIRYQEDLVPGKALLDLYDLVRLGYARTGTDELARVTSIQHTISPKGWRMKLGFSADGTVAPPQLVPSPPAVASASTSGGGGGSEPIPYGSGSATSNQSFTSAAVTLVDLGTGSVEGGMTRSGGVFTIPKAGIYLISARCAWQANDNGSRILQLRKGGATLGQFTAAAHPSGRGGNVGILVERLAAGDTISMHAYQSSGGSLVTYSDSNSTGLSVTYQGP